MNATINADKLAQLDQLRIDNGSHKSFEDGHCSLEIVSWLAGEGFTDAPSCASPVIRDYVIRLNDNWSDEKRQQLKPFLVRMIGTGSDGKDDARLRILRRYVADLAGPWFRLAGMDAEADELDAASTDAERRRVLRKAAELAWDKRVAARNRIAEKVRAELAKRPGADAAADAGAAAGAASVAASVAAADAVAAAVAGAGAVAGAVAVAAAAWNAAYKAAKAKYVELIATAETPQWQAIRELRDAQQGAALDLLDRLIDADEVASITPGGNPAMMPPPLKHTASRHGVIVLTGTGQEAWLARVKVERALHNLIASGRESTSIYGHKVDEQDLADLLVLMDESDAVHEARS